MNYEKFLSQDETNEIKEFNEYFKIEREKLPFNLNIIDELPINENSHSRILTKLFQFQVNNTFPILESFIQHFFNDEHGIKFKYKVRKPVIKAEDMRIDASVRDYEGKYAIIFENKFYYAKDQEKQISNYIEKIEKDNEIFNRKENIYIVYLTSWGGSPSKNSFSESSDFENRYLELKYNGDILAWLEYKILPNIAYKEKLLISAIEQYIDHLKGKFYLRSTELSLVTKMVQHINNTIEQKERDILIKKLYQEISKDEDCSELKNFLHYLKYARNIDILKNCYKKIKNEYTGIYKPFLKLDINYPKTGIILAYNSIEYAVLIEFNSDKNPYYGITTHFTNGSGEKDKTIEELISDN